MRDLLDKLSAIAEAEESVYQGRAVKEQLKAWYDKYNKYLGGNSDKLADGFFEAYLDTGILTDATEENEFNKAVADVFGGDSERAEYELFNNEDLKRKHLPITYAMHKEFEDIMGGPVGSSTGPDDEDNVTQAANILSLSEETLSESGKDCSCCGNKINAEGKCGCDESCEHCGGQHDLSEAAKPDYIDLDGDGDEEESMKKAAKDKEKQDESAEPRLGESWLQNYQAILVQR
jgi:hypothetical protein